MRYSSQVKPISYVKANAVEVMTRRADQREAMFIMELRPGHKRSDRTHELASKSSAHS